MAVPPPFRRPLLLPPPLAVEYSILTNRRPGPVAVRLCRLHHHWPTCMEEEALSDRRRLECRHYPRRSGYSSLGRSGCHRRLRRQCNCRPA
jgi:hypothetical protein